MPGTFVFVVVGVAAALFMIRFLLAICGRRGDGARVAYLAQGRRSTRVVSINAVGREYRAKFKNEVAGANKIIQR